MGRLDFFDSFDLSDRRTLAKMHSHFYAAESYELIIEEGSTDSAFFILLSGQVQVTMQEKETPLAHLLPGDFFGEVAFLTDTPRTCSIEAEKTSIVLRVDRKLMGLLRAEVREKIKDKIIEKLVDRLQQMNASMAKMDKTVRN